MQLLLEQLIKTSHPFTSPSPAIASDAVSSMKRVMQLGKNLAPRTPVSGTSHPLSACLMIESTLLVKAFTDAVGVLSESVLQFIMTSLMSAMRLDIRPICKIVFERSSPTLEIVSVEA